MEWTEMRANAKLLTSQEIKRFLNQNNVGHLGTFNDDGGPYVVPINYAFLDDKFVLHCASKGHKISNIQNNQNVCFEVTKHYNTKKSDYSCSKWEVQYESVVAFCKATLIDDNLKRSYLEEFTRFYTKKDYSLSEEGLERTTCIILKIEHMTGRSSDKHN